LGEAIEERMETFSKSSNEMLEAYLEAYERDVEILRGQLAWAETCAEAVRQEQSERRKKKRWLWG
jgi:hypothetical protein